MKKIGKIIKILILIIICLIIAGFILLVSGFMFIVPAMNDFKANQLEKNLTAIELPEKTKFIASDYYIGHLGNGGNGIDYFIAMIIKSEQPIEKLKKHYKGYQVKEQTSNSVEEGLLGPGHMSFKELSQVDSFENYYIVYSNEGPDPNSLLYEFDLRGH